MNYKQFRLAKRNGEIVQQFRTIISNTKAKWYKPWEYKVEYEYGEWEDIPIPELECAANHMSDKGYEVGDLKDIPERKL